MEKTDVRETGIPRAHLTPLLEEFGIVKNILSAPFLKETAGAGGDRAGARRWWGTKTPEEQYLLRAALAAMGSPALVAEMRLLLGKDRYIGTKVVMGSLRQEDPVFLVGADGKGGDLRVRMLRDAGALIDLVLFHLDLGVPMADPGVKVRCSRQEFLVFLACVDLHERAFNAHLADHTALPEEMTGENIRAAVEDGFRYSGDIRWILPFTLQGFTGSRQAPSPDTIAQALRKLVSLGLLRATAKGFAFTDAGNSVAQSLRNRLSQVQIGSAGVTEKKQPAVQSSLFYRGATSLWFADIGGEDATGVAFSSIPVPVAFELLKEIFRPVAMPPPLPVAAPAPAPAAPAKKFCRNCGEPVKPGVKFCGKCGTPVR